jgi:CSLREA domain-containing protein
MPVRSTLFGTAAVTALLALLGLAPDPALGLTFTVNAFEDLPDADTGDDLCDADLAAPDLQCTLRAAVQQANATPDADLVTLPAGRFRLTRRGAGEDLAATGDLDLTAPLTLQGAGRELTVVDGKKAKDRVFDLDGVTAVFADLTIRGGQALISDELGGGGIRALGGGADVTLLNVLVTKNKSRDDAAGIYVEVGSVLIEDSVISSNKASDDGAGFDTDGAVAVFRRTTIAKNKAGDEGGGFESSGGTVFVENCTISGNKAIEGGAMNLEEGSVTTIVGSTLAKNKAKQGSGIYLEDNDGGLDDQLSLGNTIVANKPKTNCTGEAIDSLGHNLATGTTCGLAGTGDLSDADPRLLKLADNGGSTPTHALRDDSPAIDAGGVCGQELTTDQRGQARVDVPGVGPDGETCDIGAFEFVP